MAARAASRRPSRGALPVGHVIDPALVDRFRADLQALTGEAPGTLGIAVSGGPDSLALLLLAHAAFPGGVEAATVDHGLRPESAAEAHFVAGICEERDIAHAILFPAWPEYPSGNVQARAREERYAALEAWVVTRDLEGIVTGHHMDDQAETVLMRLARGSGVRGLSGIFPSVLASTRRFAFRPLLGWRRSELAAIVAAAGLEPVMDPSNIDERYDRTRARRLLAQCRWLSPPRLAAVASHQRDAERALAWSAHKLWDERSTRQDDGSLCLDIADIPHELQWRLVLRAFRAVTFGSDDAPPPISGPKLERLLKGLRAGRQATLAGILARPGPPWRFSLAPPRRT